MIGVGLYQLYAAHKAKFREDLRLDLMSDAERRWVTHAGPVGTAARALAIGLAGAFVVLAAYQSDASEAGSLGAALGPSSANPSALTCSASSPGASSSTASLCSPSPGTAA